MKRTIHPEATISTADCVGILRLTFGNERLEGHSPLRLAGNLAVGVEAEQNSPHDFVYPHSDKPTVIVPVLSRGRPLTRSNRNIDPLSYDATASCLLLGERALFRHAGIRVPRIDYDEPGYTDKAIGATIDISSDITAAIRAARAIRFGVREKRAVQDFMVYRHDDLSVPYDQSRTTSLTDTMQLFVNRFVAASHAYFDSDTA